VLSWASGVIALIFIGYYGILAIFNPPNAIGQQFVLTEFPPQSISPWIFAKPITWFSYAGFLYWAFGLEAQRSHFLKFSGRTRRFLFIITALIAFGALYEIFFNFMLWSALEVLCNATQPSPCSPDNVYNPYPNLRSPLSLTFSTKVVTMVFAMAVYSLYYLHRVDKEIDKRSQDRPSRLTPREMEELEGLRNAPIARSQTLTAASKERSDIPDYSRSKQGP